jgi:hypothetical protein
MVSVHDQSGPAKGLQQQLGVAGFDSRALRRAQVPGLGSGAVEEIQQPGMARLGQLQQHGPSRVRPKLKPVSVTPEAT